MPHFIARKLFSAEEEDLNVHNNLILGDCAFPGNLVF